MNNVSTACFILVGAGAIASAQIQMPNIGRTTTPVEQPKPQAPGKNQMSMEEVNALDARFHKELDNGLDLSAHEKFAEAGQALTQLISEMNDALKRIGSATFPKGSFIEIDGARKPVTPQLETEWFTRTLDKAQGAKSEATALQNVAALQKNAGDLMAAGKYPDDVEAYRRSAQELTANKAAIKEDNFRFFMDRAGNGERSAIAGYWAAEFKRLRDRYNKTTEGNMAPEEVRRTIQSVADEISSKGYLDPAKNPDMPDDARGLFRTLADAAKTYLSQ